MKWRQFFTPVKSMDSQQARELIENMPGKIFQLGELTDNL